MDGRPNIFRRTALRGLALAVAMALPASAGAPALAESGTGRFETSFSAVPAPSTAFVAVASAVDIAAIEPAVEAEDEGRSIAGGVASFYADKFNGRRTASGEAFSNSGLTAAHRTLPFGTRLRVTNPSNGKSVVVRVNDRGPFHGNRVLDVSRAAASELGLVQRGSGRVELALLD
ncbi:septal ring lytic transglycosylase RlpA family protein [Tsuneonella amylolytica]|uniref:septal ring lytic transglycosylase RlpA family protein n=1 Tax=Tsuneonella amylolytica TaxID=2338327 RepID=UPI000EAA98F1|nr:septal ring lytic transglycosylase RlpA family protein [Tsuneonella amylolytica]